MRFRDVFFWSYSKENCGWNGSCGIHCVHSLHAFALAVEATRNTAIEKSNAGLLDSTKTNVIECSAKERRGDGSIGAHMASLLLIPYSIGDEDDVLLR